MKASSFTIVTPVDFGLALTVRSHGYYQTPPFGWDGAKGVFSIAMRLPGGEPFIACVKENGAGSLRVTFPGGLDDEQKREARRVVSHCLKLDEDLSGFHSLCVKTEKFRDAERLGAGRLLRSPTVFEDIVKAQLSTNVAWKQAVRMIHNLCQLGAKVPGSDRRIFPEPGVILSAGDAWLRENGRVGYRAGYVIALCAKVVDGSLDLSRVDRGEIRGDDLKRLFISIKGVGKSTAHYLLMLHGEYSHLSIDSATHALMRKITGKEMSDAQIEARYRRWGKYKALALWYEWVTVSGWLDRAENGAIIPNGA
jgi:N-glycosylase/DNA lyase